MAIGGILALVYAATRGRVGPARPRAAALVLAAVGFAVVVLVPFLKYPGNPPGSSDDGSIGQRTGLYLVMLLFSVLVAALATALGKNLVARLGTWNASIVAVVAYLLVVAVGGALLPTVNETPDGFPATVLYDFRIAALGVTSCCGRLAGVRRAGSTRAGREQQVLGGELAEVFGSAAEPTPADCCAAATAMPSRDA